MHKLLRNIILTIFLSVLFCQSAEAQIGEYRNRFSVGVNGGYVLSNISFVPKVQQKFQTGTTFGMTMRYTSEKYFSTICAIQAEINYAQLGWNEDILTDQSAPVINKITGEAEKYSRCINYLQVPVFAHLGWGREQNGFQFFFQAGPQFGYYINESTDKNFDLKDINLKDRASQIYAQDSMKVENKFDYGITVGLGLEYSRPRLGRFGFEVRYYYGLGNIYGNSKRDFFGRSNHGAIMAKLSYLFDITK